MIPVKCGQETMESPESTVVSGVALATELLHQLICTAEGLAMLAPPAPWAGTMEVTRHASHAVEEAEASDMGWKPWDEAPF
jgi:hypothetical protein